MREISVDNLIKRDLDGFGADVYWRKKHANKYQKNGTADYYGAYKGKYISIEAKAGNGHPLSMAQLFDGYQVVRAERSSLLFPIIQVSLKPSVIR